MIFKSSVSSLLANKLRSILAMLGIIIGVGAVVAMLAIGAGAKQSVLARIQSMGTNLLVVRPGQRGSHGVMSGTAQTLAPADALAIVKDADHVVQVSPVVSGSAQIKYFNHNSNVSVNGVAGTYLAIRDYQLAKGRLFTEEECDRLARVAIIGPTTAKDLMGRGDAVGERIKINGINFLVIGVTVAKGDKGFFNPDDQVLIPYTTAMKQVFGLDHLREIDIQAQSEKDLNTVQSEVETILRTQHRIRPGHQDDFTIRNQADIIQTASMITSTFTILLGSIAGISLLVGGIGIMNIMLVTVTERTREIGIRKAVGAKERDILRQFLLEAVLMSGIGGLFGLVGGIGTAQLVAALTSFTPIVQATSALLALGFAASVGIFFGFYPAKRAAMLDPIEALRYE